MDRASACRSTVSVRARADSCDTYACTRPARHDEPNVDSSGDLRSHIPDHKPASHTQRDWVLPGVLALNRSRTLVDALGRPIGRIASIAGITPGIIGAVATFFFAFIGFGAFPTL